MTFECLHLNQKTNEKYFCISAQASKTGQIIKMMTHYHANWSLFIFQHNNLHSFFDLTYFREVGQKYRNIFVRFLVQMKTSKSHIEINWPLGVLFATSIFQSFCAAYVIKSLFSLVSYHDLHIDRRTNHKHSFRNLTNSKIDR